MQTNSTSTELLLSKLEAGIREHVIVTSEQHKITLTNGSDEGKWLFDFRKILLDPEYIDTIAELFWRKCEHLYPFQVGGQESAAIPLVAAIVMHGIQRGTPVSGFFIRKNRKKTGLQMLVEGTLTNEPVFLVDDLINGGGTLLHQIEILERLNKRITGCFVITQFRPSEDYEQIKERSVPIFSLFSLKKFGLTVAEIKSNRIPFKKSGFRRIWKFTPEKANHFYVLPKSTPTLDDANIYFGSDSGTFWALKQEDGSVVWKYRTWRGSRGKHIFSSPLLYNRTLYFGGYDGTLYALDSKTGAPLWMNYDADWIGSSPVVAPKHNLLFIGMEFGLFQKMGGIAAIDAKTGVTKWQHAVPHFVHSTPFYDQKTNTVIIGSNGDGVYAFNAHTGDLKWLLPISSEVKESFALDTKSEVLFFGAFDGQLYAVDINSGKVMWKYQTEGPIYSTPITSHGRVYIGSTDKRFYCLDSVSGKKLWQYETNGRILSKPQVINSHVYIGANDGNLYEFDIDDGNLTDFFIAGERLTSPVLYNSTTKKWFLLTNANELYCMEKRLNKNTKQ